MTDVWGLAEKRAVVIGGGLGIGEATCVNLARAGAAVAVVDIDIARAERVVRDIRAFGGTAIPLARDVLDVSQSGEIISDAVTGLGGLDVLVTVVGQAAMVPTLEVTPEIWDHDHSRNLRYVFFIAQAFARFLISAQCPGTAVCVASVSGIQSSPRHAAYGAAKAGLIQLVRTLAVEFAPYGIRVNAVAPGSIATPRKSSPERIRELREGPLPMKRIGEVDEVANAILYLAGGLSTYTTGQTTVVDGGWTAANLRHPVQAQDPAAPPLGSA